MKALSTRKRIRLASSAYQQGHAFFITMATHLKYPWFSLYPNLGQDAVEKLCDLAASEEMALYAWCVMPDHVHVLLGGSGIIEFARLFKGTMTPRARKIEPARRLWQRSFFDHAVRKEESLIQVSRYIWENPIRASMVKDPRGYPFSGSDVWKNWQAFYGPR